MEPKAQQQSAFVSTSTWLVSGICSAIATGFTVQVAHKIGAKDEHGARDVLRYGLMTVILAGVILGLIASV